MNAVLWARVSSREQREGYSIAAQLRAMRDKAQKSGWTVIREFVIAESAKRGAERGAFNQMLRWVKANAKKEKIDSIVSHKLDRICRDLRDALRLRDLEDACGVKLRLKGEDEIRKAFNEIIENARRYRRNADVKGCIVSPMMEEGIEVVIGTKMDEQFGPVIMFGVGGILVEVVKDVSFRVLPLSRSAARKMISEIQSHPILNGFRGRPPVDKKAITRLLMTISDVVEAYPQIKEMDLNPVIAYEDGVTVVDARIILKNGKNGKDWCRSR